jgi:hypothetical protein
MGSNRAVPWRREGQGIGHRCPNGRAVPTQARLGPARIRTVLARPGLVSGPCRAGPRAPSEAQTRPARLIIMPARPTARQA